MREKQLLVLAGKRALSPWRGTVLLPVGVLYRCGKAGAELPDGIAWTGNIVYFSVFTCLMKSKLEKEEKKFLKGIRTFGNFFFCA